jgi:hypothetical protein
MCTYVQGHGERNSFIVYLLSGMNNIFACLCEKSWGLVLFVTFVFVCVCVRACTCVFEWAWVCLHACACMCVCVCVHACIGDGNTIRTIVPDF